MSILAYEMLDRQCVSIYIYPNLHRNFILYKLCYKSTEQRFSPVTTPIEPVNVRLSATITSAPIAMQYPPLAATSDIEAMTGFEAAKSRISLHILQIMHQIMIKILGIINKILSKTVIMTTIVDVFEIEVDHYIKDMINSYPI